MDSKDKNNKLNPGSRFLWITDNNIDGKIIDREINSEVCKIVNTCIQDLRLRPNGEIIIGNEAPIPLFWRQYQNHHDPERSACIRQNLYARELDDNLIINIKSTNRSGSITSKYCVEISYSEEMDSYIFFIKSNLTINPSQFWRVACNPSHGEVEFCNFYPADVFVKSEKKPKKYQVCVYEDHYGKLIRLPHIHMDIPSYQNIFLNSKACFYYLLEKENPVIQFIEASSGNIEAGICSYMWDSHFGIRVTQNQADKILNDTNEFNSSYKIFSIDYNRAKRILEQSKSIDFKEIKKFPIYVEGLNTFSKTALDFDQPQNVWSWQNEYYPLDINSAFEKPVFELDNTTGYTDSNSLKLEIITKGIGRWFYSAFGPEFGKQEFDSNKKYKLIVYLKTGLNDESFVRIGFRMHFEGEENLFDPKKYLYFYSKRFYNSPEKENWIKAEFETIKIDKKPDRLHILLELNGDGICWFDDLSFEIF